MNCHSDRSGGPGQRKAGAPRPGLSMTLTMSQTLVLTLVLGMATARTSIAQGVKPGNPQAALAGATDHPGHAGAAAGGPAKAGRDGHDHHGTPAPLSPKGLRAQRFDERVWPQLLAKGPRPAAYLFTTTTCATCPAAFEALHQAARAAKLRRAPRLAAVVMDVDGPQALRHARHFAGMSALYVFDGFEPAIRQAVDPGWPNVTPYVVLIDRLGQVQRLLGQPDAASMQRWLD